MMSAVIRMEELAAHPEYLSIADIDGVRLDLRYACANNFVGRNLYGDAAPALLHRRAAEQLSQAARALSLQRPGYRLRVFDALRRGGCSGCCGILSGHAAAHLCGRSGARLDSQLRHGGT